MKELDLFGKNTESEISREDLQKYVLNVADAIDVPEDVAWHIVLKGKVPAGFTVYADIDMSDI